MITLAYIILIFTIIQFLVALLNLISETSLPETKDLPSALVSVLIPARNEEKNIGNILNDLITQDYSKIEIIVFDDQSDDRTADIIKGYFLSDKRIRMVSSQSLPEGWLGKNYACHSLAKYAKGDFLLFLDADVRINKNIIGKAVSFAEKHKLSLISIFPKQIIRSAGERITVPNMNYILLSLLPLISVRKLKYPSMAAANGQFMFFRAHDYHSLEPHMLMKNNKVEDIFTAKYLKKIGSRIACLVGDRDINCRMYQGFSDAVEGFSKNVIAFFGNSFIMALFFWLVTTLGFIPVFLYLSNGLIILWLVLYLLTRILISITSRQNPFYNLILIIPLQVSLGIFIYKAFINKHFRKFQWKGRNIE